MNATERSGLRVVKVRAKHRVGLFREGAIGSEHF